MSEVEIPFQGENLFFEFGAEPFIVSVPAYREIT
jgi:hypothetical protein